MWEEVLPSQETTYHAQGICVTFTPQLLKRQDAYYAARMLDTGLTAYGETIEKATVKLQKMFESWSRAYVEIGGRELLLKRLHERDVCFQESSS
jgi:hypothetical protein